jgi:hypothetical protein
MVLGGGIAVAVDVCRAVMQEGGIRKEDLALLLAVVQEGLRLRRARYRKSGSQSQMFKRM